MKKVEAEIRKEMFPDVDLALKRAGIPGLTIAEEKVAGRGIWSYPIENVRHLLLTVIVDDAGVKSVVESIRGSASTSSCADGRIVVSPVDQVFDIGSGRSDMSELMVPSLIS